MNVPANPFKVGDHVRLSELGRSQALRVVDGDAGIVRRLCRDGLVAVVWMGRKTIERWHPDLLAIAPDGYAPVRTRSSHNSGPLATRNAQVRSDRKMIRKAFELVRYDSERVADRDRLLAALAGREALGELADDGFQIVYSRETVRRAEEIIEGTGT